MKIRYSVLLAAAFALGGCQHPFVKFDAPVFQSKVEEVADWDSLADRHAARLVNTIEAPNAPSCKLDIDGQSIDAPTGNAPIFIEASTSKFAESFRPLIEKHLIEKGFTVSTTRRDACWSVQLDTQTFLYDKKTNSKSPVEYATFWSTISALTMLALDRNYSFDSFSVDTGAGIVAAAGPALDVFHEINDRTNAEVLLVLTVEKYNRVLYSGTEVFYVHPSDLWRYWRNNLSVATLPVRTTRAD